MIQIYQISEASGREYLIGPDRFDQELQRLLNQGITAQQHDLELKRYQQARYQNELAKYQRCLEAAE
jgi:hypothetical protein